jgi:hypothetical protein
MTTKAKVQAHPVEVQLFIKRARFYNDVLGALSFTLALAALGTDAPRFYAFVSLLFVVLIMASHGKQYERVYRLWREVNHELTRTRLVWRSFLVFIVGWLSLGAVAAGLLTKGGVVGFA